jgi:hypothetical protein
MTCFTSLAWYCEASVQVLHWNITLQGCGNVCCSECVFGGSFDFHLLYLLKHSCSLEILTEKNSD